MTFCFTEVCPYGSIYGLDEDNQDAFTVDVSDQDNDSEVLGDSPVTLPAPTTITVEPAPVVEDVLIMQLEITVQYVTEVTFTFYRPDGSVLSTEDVSSYYLRLDTDVYSF